MDDAQRQSFVDIDRRQSSTDVDIKGKSSLDGDSKGKTSSESRAQVPNNVRVANLEKFCKEASMSFLGKKIWSD